MDLLIQFSECKYKAGVVLVAHSIYVSFDGFSQHGFTLYLHLLFLIAGIDRKGGWFRGFKESGNVVTCKVGQGQ